MSLIFKMIYNYIEEEIYYNDEYKRNIIENICILFINISTTFMYFIKSL